MTTRIVTDSNGRKHITNEPILHPPQRQWVGLSDEERNEITNTVMIDIWQVARAIEAKLKEKNT
ncbi:MAG: hypothetical protein ACKO0Z_10330 [Betaproteobacteria bacterium]